MRGKPEKSESPDMKLIKTGSPVERMEAAQRLGEEKNKNAVPVLIEALNDPDQHVRGWAAWSLAEIGSTDAVDPLIEALFKYSHLHLTSKEPSDQDEACLSDFYVALEKLTGQKLGLDAVKWKKWQQEERERKAKNKSSGRKDRHIGIRTIERRVPLTCRSQTVEKRNSRVAVGADEPSRSLSGSLSRPTATSGD
jgi:hypothetical protein